MSGCCEENKKAKDALEATVTLLRGDKDRLEQMNAELNREVDEARDAEEDAAERMEDAEEAQDQAIAELRDEKDRELATLRKLEWCLHGLCPVCHGLPDHHKTACQLKLEIFRLDHELNRSEYIHR
jgi:chromosome segregation ATPase